MRRLGALAALFVLAAACSSTAPNAALPSPDETPSATPVVEAVVEPVATAPAPTPPPPPVAPPVLRRPIVTLDRRVFPIGPVQGFVAPTADDAAIFAASLTGIATSYGDLLTRYANLPRMGQADQDSTRMQFDAMHAAPRYVEVLRRWLAYRGADDDVTVEIRDIALDRAYAKPWGRLAMIEVHFVLVDQHKGKINGPSTEERTVRLRMSVTGNWQVIDAFDATAGRWLEGESPRYSAFSLESEVPDVVAEYLSAESFAPGVSPSGAARPPTTAFWKARLDALTEIGRLFDSGALVDRHFEDVTARILRFEPATYVGDGVLTVSLTGKLVEIAADGTKRTVSFTQPLKFLRTYGGGVSWFAADAQESDGSWDSGGVLALSEIDRTFG
jgi:hypothetical protein